MSAETTDKPYTLRSLEEMLGLSRSVVSSLISAGFVSPSRGSRNEYRFSFQDVVLLRTAYHLRAANIPPRRLLRSLKQLKERLPDELPLSGLRIRAIGNDVAVHEGGAPWEVETGQLLMDFEVAPAQGSVSFLQRPADLPADVVASDDWFARGEELEAEDDVAAEAAYRRAIELDPDFVDAYINLGALLCEAGRCGEAVALYDDAIERSPDTATLHFNRAIALEDRRRDADALQSYDRCLALAPDFADAHFNAARLHEKLGHAQRALRHYSAYRRLQAGV